MVEMREIGRKRREVKWIKHYCSGHDILLVGEGDFSFTLSLAMAFGDASNIVATSLDSYERLVHKYKSAKRNLALLEIMGASILHGVDATRMMSYPDLQRQKFHRIIFNFPHAGFGFYKREDNPLLIRMHRKLVWGFFRNARSMLKADGEIHINHKTTGPFIDWKIEDLASENSLLLTGCSAFSINDYPGYNNKRGSGRRCDKPFRLGQCRTFRFQLCCPYVQRSIPKIMATKYSYTLHRDVNAPLFDGLMLDVNVTNECYKVFGGYLNRVEPTFGRRIDDDDDVYRTVSEALKFGYERYTKPGGTVSGFIGILQELRALSVLRSARLKEMISLFD